MFTSAILFFGVRLVQSQSVDRANPSIAHNILYCVVTDRQNRFTVCSFLFGLQFASSFSVTLTALRVFVLLIRDF